MDMRAPHSPGRIPRLRAIPADQPAVLGVEVGPWSADLPAPRRLGTRAARAFSLIELLTSVSIMMVIIYALYSMFNQTQKALRGNITQVDVMESGRATAELLGRELEQMTACNLGGTNLSSTNFYVGMTPSPPLLQMDVAQNPSQPALRTNILQEFFFLSRQTNKWYGTGYRVMRADDGVGTLYRINSGPVDLYGVQSFSGTLTASNLMHRFAFEPLIDPATRESSTNFNRVAEGIIHLRLAAYDPDGRRMEAVGTNQHPSYRILSLGRGGAVQGLYSTAASAADATVILQSDPLDPHRVQTRMTFLNNALPGYIELELGVLEPTAWKQYQSLRDSPQVASQFLKKQAAKVHLFRQRIPLRTALE